ncbi:MAG: lipoyl(octanoyl) transferase LipB [Microbacterium sp.]
MRRRTMRVETLGLDPSFVPYEKAWEIQREVHAEVVAGTREDTLLLLEHEAVYTAGKRTEPHERPQDGTPVIDVDRGGKITWHGPGQLVGYPILRLPEPLAVVDHVRRLERVLIDVVGGFGIDGFQVPGRSGVWVRGVLHDEKIAAIGVRVSQGVTMHGFALNCSNALGPFETIVPCGIADAGVATMSAQLGRAIRPVEVVRTVVDAFAREYEAAAA